MHASLPLQVWSENMKDQEISGNIEGKIANFGKGTERKAMGKSFKSFAHAQG